MNRLWYSLGWLGVGAVVYGFGLATGYSLCRQAANRAVWQAEDRALAYGDSMRMARADVRVDSVRVDSVVTRWRTARAGVDTITDTLRLVDTLRILVADAEQALNICTLAFDGCQQTLALAARQTANDSARLARSAALIAIERDRANRAEGKTWRHRLEGVAACGVGVYTINQLTRK